MDDASWIALTVTLTLLGGAWTVYAVRHRGAASALRGAGITLAFPALYLTDTLDTIVDIGAEITSWATRLVLSPTVWLGIALAGMSALLLGASSFLRSRELGRAEDPAPELPSGRPATQADPGRAAPGRGSKTRSQGGGTGDPEMDEIEEILRRRGIS